MILGFAGSLLLSHFYGAAMLGRIAAITSMIAILTLLAMLGNHIYVLRVIPTMTEKWGADTAFKTFIKIVVLVLISSVVIIVLASVLLPFTKSLGESIKQNQLLVFALVFVTVLKRISLQALRALGDYKVFSLFHILPALFMILTVLVGASLSVGNQQFLYLYYVPHFLLAVIAFYLVFRVFSDLNGSVGKTTSLGADAVNSAIPTFKQMLTISTPMLGVALSNTAIAHTDILMLSAFTNDETVGVFSVYVKISALMSLGIMATNSMYSPKASKLFDAGKIKELGKLTRQTTSLIFFIALASLLALMFIHRFLLGLYGPEFSQHLTAFYLSLIHI